MYWVDEGCFQGQDFLYLPLHCVASHLLGECGGDTISEPQVSLRSDHVTLQPPNRAVLQGLSDILHTGRF